MLKKKSYLFLYFSFRVFQNGDYLKVLQFCLIKNRYTELVVEKRH